jgi:hypothetical protein
MAVVAFAPYMVKDETAANTTDPMAMAMRTSTRLIPEAACPDGEERSTFI